MDSNQKFWLTFWLLVAIVACTAICVPVRAAFTNNVEMAKAGYVEKIVIIGNPNDTYSRRVEKVWVKVNDAPNVESK